MYTLDDNNTHKTTKQQFTQDNLKHVQEVNNTKVVLFIASSFFTTHI